jgi:hypothetical protein
MSVTFNQTDSKSVNNTFSYFYHKIKHGLKVEKKNGKIAVTRINNANFKNEWGDKVSIPFKYSTLDDFLSRASFLDGFSYTKCKPIGEWYANNSIVRYDSLETTHNIVALTNMFESLLTAYPHIQDFVLFVNKRDFPVLKNDLTEPYNFIFGNDRPLLSHKYNSYAPIGSMSKKDGFADLLIPTWYDWGDVRSRENISFPTLPLFEPYSSFSTLWEDRFPIAVFRGSSTGNGVDENSNVRLKMARMGEEFVFDDDDDLPLMDIGVTKVNHRPRVCPKTQQLRTVERDFKCVPFLSKKKQSEFKYIINVDGYVSSFRLFTELGMGSCILKTESEYSVWYSDKLIPYVHYVPILDDLSNLADTVKWCKRHDEECKQIATQAKEFWTEYCNKNTILKYLYDLVETTCVKR